MREFEDSVKIGSNSHIRGELLTFNYGGNIEIGDNTFVGVGAKIWSGESVKIGSNVLISHNVNIIDSDSHEIDYLFSFFNTVLVIRTKLFFLINLK